MCLLSVHDLEVLPAEDFDTAISSLTGGLNVELLAQLRDNGRVPRPLEAHGGRQQILVPMNVMFQLLGDSRCSPGPEMFTLDHQYLGLGHHQLGC